MQGSEPLPGAPPPRAPLIYPGTAWNPEDDKAGKMLVWVSSPFPLMMGDTRDCWVKKKNGWLIATPPACLPTLLGDGS